MRQRPVLLGVAAILIAASCGMASPGDARPAGAAHIPARLASSEYRLAYASDATVDLAAMVQGKTPADTTSFVVATALTGRVLARVVGARAGATLVFVRVTDTAMRIVINGEDKTQECDAARRVMARGFLVEVRRDGTVDGVRLGVDVPALSAEIIRGLAAAVQIVRPAGAGLSGQRIWTAEERDPLGIYLARYETRGARGGRVIVKTKLRYLPAAGTPVARQIPGRRTQVQSVVPETLVTIQLDADSVLPTSLDGTESLTTTINGQRVGHSTSRIQLLARAAPVARPLDRQARAVVAELAAAPSQPLLLVPDPDADEAAIQRGALGNADATTVLAQLAAAGEDPHMRDTVYLKLKALAYLHPEADVSLADALRIADPDSARFAVLTGSLAAVADPPAQAALASVIRARTTDSAAVAALVPALAGAPQPTPEAEAILRALVASKDAVIAEQGLLGLGGMARQLAEAQPARAAAIVATLATSFAEARAEAYRASLLEALGNAGTRDIAPTVLSALADLSPLVRRAALHALRFVATADADASIVKALATDPDPQVRYAAAFALGFAERGAGLRAAEIAAFTAEANEYVRGAILENLAKAPASESASTDVIAKAAVGDPSDYVRTIAAGLLSKP